MTFDIISPSGIALSTGLDENAPAIRLDQGRVLDNGKHPRNLEPGESTRVSYPLEGRCVYCRGLGEIKRYIDEEDE